MAAIAVYMGSVLFSAGITFILQQTILSGSNRKQPASPKPVPKKKTPKGTPKSPLLAALLSFLLFSGGGQVYLGETSKGFGIIIFDCFLAILIFWSSSESSNLSSWLFFSQSAVLTIWTLTKWALKIYFTGEAYCLAKINNGGSVSFPKRLKVEISKEIAIVLAILFTSASFVFSMYLYTYLEQQFI